MELVSGQYDVPLNTPGVKLTYDDFVLFPDDGKRHELIDGEHYVTPSPNLKHQKISGNLYLLIRTWLEEHRIGVRAEGELAGQGGLSPERDLHHQCPGQARSTAVESIPLARGDRARDHLDPRRPGSNACRRAFTGP